MDFLFVYTYVFTYVHLFVYTYVYINISICFFHMILWLTAQVVLNAFSIDCLTLHTRPAHGLLFVIPSCVLLNRRNSIYLYQMFSIWLHTIGIYKIISMLQIIERNYECNNCIVHNIITCVYVICNSL